MSELRRTCGTAQGGDKKEDTGVEDLGSGFLIYKCDVHPPDYDNR